MVSITRYTIYIVIAIVVIVVAYTVWRYTADAQKIIAPAVSKRENYTPQYTPQCTSCSVETQGDSRAPINDKGENVKMLPIFNPAFNFREGAKQLLLLEDHLYNKQKFCQDCCKKHALTAEALFEEAQSLDTEHKYESMCNDLPRRVRDIIGRIGKDDPISIADDVRRIRKPIHVYFADKYLS